MGGGINLPFGISIRHIGARRGELDAFGNHASLERAERLLIDQVHGEGLIAICPARQRHHQPGAVSFGFDGPIVDVTGPEFRAGRELETLELFVVVFHHERSLREHLTFLG